ncbi:hypothetical protein [Opitutus sp. GAS368]|uniref:hypothetical protein n=1 Tax=Opitutus sp. GAS368 TaxID=1882749 RepID=UPI00087DAF7E|nr:hypothetical protein [Opitutus sp. GAS368]SDR74574.1 hypothetical protein SAMN05444173_0702 [Opitutus sp. GAS368]
MNNQPSPAAQNPDEPGRPACYWEKYDDFLKQCGDEQLWSMLREIQGRLGTRMEKPRDLEHVRAITHRLNNILTAISMKNDLAQLKAWAANSRPLQCNRPDGQMQSGCGD